MPNKTTLVLPSRIRLIGIGAIDAAFLFGSGRFLEVPEPDFFFVAFTPRLSCNVLDSYKKSLRAEGRAWPEFFIVALQRGNLIHVGVAEWKTADEPDALWTTLGSCVGIVLYSTKKKTGGLAHVLLGETPAGKIVHRGKYARPAVEGLTAELEKRGLSRSDLSARIFGGASMFEASHSAFMNQIGSDNVAAVKSALSALGIPILAEDTGGTSGRTITIYMDDGRIFLRSGGREKYLYKA